MYRLSLRWYSTCDSFLYYASKDSRSLILVMIFFHIKINIDWLQQLRQMTDIHQEDVRMPFDL